MTMVRGMIEQHGTKQSSMDSDYLWHCHLASMSTTS
jgi:hypothetical protein